MSFRRRLRKLLGRRLQHRATWIYPMPSRRALYFAVPKVACTTWLRICCTDQGIDLAQVDRATWFDAIPHIGPDEIAAYEGWYRFGFVRNPWDRLVSCYLNKILSTPAVEMPTFENGIPKTFQRYGRFRAGMSFAEFARAVAEIPDHDADDHFRSQFQFFERRGAPLAMDHVGRFEAAPESFRLVIERLGLEIDSLPHAKQTKGRKHYLEYYPDKSLIDLVGERYQQDVERFGYSFATDGPAPAS